MSLAETARTLVDRHPWLRRALQAGVLNYAAASRWLNLEDESAGAAALRRYEQELPALQTIDSDLRVRMQRVQFAEFDLEHLSPIDLDPTAFRADAVALLELENGPTLDHFGAILARIRNEDLTVLGLRWTPESALLAVPAKMGPRVLQLIESTANGRFDEH